MSQAHNQVQKGWQGVYILSGILGGIIDALGGAEVWVLAPTCCILRMPIAGSVTTAGVSGPMTDTISSPGLYSSGMLGISVGSLEVS